MRRLVLLPALLTFLVGAVPALAWTWPVDGPVLQSFALAADPYAAGQHRGIDVAATEGAPVRAPAAGTVSFAGAVPDGGRSVTVLTPDGYAVTLLHLGSVLVAEGDAVGEGAQIGVAGWSGDAEHATPSVHLGVRVTAEPAGYLDPLQFLPPPPAAEPSLQQEPAPPGPAPAVEVDVQGGEIASPVGDEATLLPGPETAVPALVVVADGEQSELAAAPSPDQLEPLAGEPAQPITPLQVDVLPEQAAGASGWQPEPRPSAAETPQASASTAGEPLGAPPPPASSPGAQLGTRGERAGDPAGRDSGARKNQARVPGARPSGPAAPARARTPARLVGRDLATATRQGPVAARREPSVARVAAARGGGWPWRALVAVSAVALAALLVVRRRGPGGRRASVTGEPPLAPTTLHEPRFDAGAGSPMAPPCGRRSLHPRAGEQRRQHDRGGPGGPATRPAPGPRRERASV